VGTPDDDIRVMAAGRLSADHGGTQPSPGVHSPEPTMNLLHRLWSRLTPPAGPPARLLAHDDAGNIGDADEPPCLGCGWFDSSHELQTGLLVSEHDDDEVVAVALPLATWLELQLADWQPDGPVKSH
jgi:hypothetical protein